MDNFCFGAEWNGWCLDLTRYVRRISSSFGHVSSFYFHQEKKKDILSNISAHHFFLAIKEKSQPLTTFYAPLRITRSSAPMLRENHQFTIISTKEEVLFRD